MIDRPESVVRINHFRSLQSGKGKVREAEIHPEAENAKQIETAEGTAKQSTVGRGLK